MTRDEVHRRALALKGATVDVKWGSDVFSIGGKMFAACGGRTGAVSFKTSEMAFELLIETGVAKPAPYLARARWVQLLNPPGLTDDEVAAYLAQAHELVSAKLSRRLRAEIGL